MTSLMNRAAMPGIIVEASSKALDAVPIGRSLEPEELARVPRVVARPESRVVTGPAHDIYGGPAMD